MNPWTPAAIKTLRQKLGWTRAELSRRVGVTVSTIQAWEEGAGAPEAEAQNTLLSLEGHLQKYSDSLSTDPLAEKVLAQKGLNQVMRNDLRILNDLPADDKI